MYRSNNCSAAGFTLVEVLVTLVILATSLAAIGSLIAVGVKGTRASEEHLTMTQAARRIMTSLPDDREIDVGTISGESGGFRWRLDVAPYPTALVNPAVTPPWIPLHMMLTLQAPGGRVLQIATVRLRRRP